MTQVLWRIQRRIGSLSHDLHRKQLPSDHFVDKSLVEFLTETLNEFVGLFLSDESNPPIDLCRNRLPNDLLTDFYSVNAARIVPNFLSGFGAKSCHNPVLRKATYVLHKLDAKLFKFASNAVSNPREFLHLQFSQKF